MVDFNNISAYDSPPPDDMSSNKDRAIRRLGPIYDLDEIKLAAKQRIFPATRKCSEDIQRLGFDLGDVCDLIQKLSKSDYRKSMWCTTSGNGANVVACDDYRIEIRHLNASEFKLEMVEYYLKFGLGKKGNLLLMVSCHPA